MILYALKIFSINTVHILITIIISFSNIFCAFDYMPKNVAAVFTYILFVSGLIWNENIILYIAFYWLCELFFTIPQFSLIYIHTKECTQLSQFEWFWNRNQDRQKFPVWIVWLFKKQQNMFSVWTTQKYVLPKNAAQRKPQKHPVVEIYISTYHY